MQYINTFIDNYYECDSLFIMAHFKVLRTCQKASVDYIMRCTYKDRYVGCVVSDKIIRVVIYVKGFIDKALAGDNCLYDKDLLDNNYVDMLKTCKFRKLMVDECENIRELIRDSYNIYYLKLIEVSYIYK